MAWKMDLVQSGRYAMARKLIRKSLKIALNHTKKLLTHLIYIYLYYLSCAQGGEKTEFKL